MFFMDLNTSLYTYSHFAQIKSGQRLKTTNYCEVLLSIDYYPIHYWSQTCTTHTSFAFTFSTFLPSSRRH